MSDSSTHKIRRLNETHLTTAYDGFPLTSPKGMAIDQENPLVIYVVISHGLVMLNLLSGHAVTLNAAASAGFGDGQLETSKFNSPRSILQVSASSFLLTDTGNNRLRIMDVENETVSSICTGEFNKNSLFA